jgi:hypothetical protein
MKDAAQLSRRASFPKMDAIDQLFFEKFDLAIGASTDSEKAALLGMGWLTLYRARKGIGRPSNELITALVCTFPDAAYTFMFDTREEAVVAA